MSIGQHGPAFVCDGALNGSVYGLPKGRYRSSGNQIQTEKDQSTYAVRHRTLPEKSATSDRVYTTCIQDVYCLYEIKSEHMTKAAKERLLLSERSISTERLRDLAYRHLQTKLSRGELPAGVALSEVPLSQELGISRTPVREAIGLLVAEGFLEQIPNRGTVVRQLARRDIVELYELREALEVYAVGKVTALTLAPAERKELTDQVNEIARLRTKLVESGQDRLDDDEMLEFATADITFHNLILRLAGNGRILKVVSDSRLLIRIFALPHQGHDPEQLAGIEEYHQRILEAVFDGNGELAKRLLAEHIQVSLRERIDAHESWEREQHLSRAMAGRLK